MFSPTNLLSSSYYTCFSNYEEALQTEPLSPHTRRNYLTQVRQFLLFAQKHGCDSQVLLSTPHVRDHIIELYRISLKEGLQARSGSINTVLATIKHFYRLNGEEVPPADREPSQKIERTVLQSEHIARLLGILREPLANKDRAIVTLFLFGGIRLKECVDLNVTDVMPTLDGFKILVVTGNEPRAITLTGEAAQYFQPWWIERDKKIFHASEALFINRQGERISPSGFDSIIRKTGLRARLVLSARVLRNTWKKEQEWTRSNLMPVPRY